LFKIKIILKNDIFTIIFGKKEEMSDNQVLEENPIFENKEDFLKFFTDILQNDQNEICKNLYKELIDHGKNNEGELEFLLQQISEIEPYNFLVPTARMYLNLLVHDIDSCCKFLNKFKSQLTNPDQIESIESILKIINNEDEVELEFNLGTKLCELANEVIAEDYNRFTECCCYLNSLME
jgi:hypothetical protein